MNYDEIQEQQRKYDSTLRDANVFKKKPHKIIELLINGQIQTRNFPSSSGAYAIESILKNDKLNRNYKDGFFQFITLLSKKNVDVLQTQYVIMGLFHMYSLKEHWIKDIQAWKKDTYNLERQVKSIARHLFCKYPMPKFMENVWITNASDWERNLYVHMGKGNSPRTFDEFAISITKKDSSKFLSAPENYRIDEALFWGKILALGGDERMVKPMMESRIFRSFNSVIHRRVDVFETNQWGFWETIMKFFVEQPLLDVNSIAPVCDYIHHVKYEHRQLPKPGGGWITAKPENPDFRINGRTLQALVRSMEKWHKEVSGAKKTNLKNWMGFDMPNYEISFGKDTNKKTYTFTQLLSSNALIVEGRTHGHCVAGYANSCATGKTSIWSMTVQDFMGIHKNLLTIEISPSKTIVQCRGKANRLADGYEWGVVQRFATDRNLEISRWVSFTK